jgi:3-oxoacyl-[acyl-carrier-protein] synthase-1
VIGTILSVGARSPLGLSSLTTAMCVRARKLEPRALGLRDRRGREIGMCVTAGIGPAVVGMPRMVRLAAPALSEALAGAAGALGPLEGARLPLVLVLPEPGRPDEETQADIVAELASRSDAPIDAARSRLVRAGAAGFAQALQGARELLEGDARAVVVGGVDSYYHPEVLRWLDDGHRLHALGVEDGMLPSEAAAFVVIGRAGGGRAPRADAATGPRTPSLGTVAWAAHGDEPAAMGDAPPIAETLTDLFLEMQDAVGTSPWLVSDDNGERWRTQELSLCALRMKLGEGARSRWAADLGDCGAATGPLFAAIVARMWAAGCAPARRAALALASNGPARGLVVMEAAHA